MSIVSVGSSSYLSVGHLRGPPQRSLPRLDIWWSCLICTRSHQLGYCTSNMSCYLPSADYCKLQHPELHSRYRSGTVKYPTSNCLTPKWGNFLIGFLIGAIKFLIISRQVGHRPNVGKFAGLCLEDRRKHLSVGQCPYEDHQPANPSEYINFNSDLLSQIRSTPI